MSDFKGDPTTPQVPAKAGTHARASETCTLPILRHGYQPALGSADGVMQRCEDGKFRDSMPKVQ